MKTTLFIALMLISVSIKAQLNGPFGFECNMPSGSQSPENSLIGGQHKPESIDNYTTDPNAYFPVLIVYVQFPSDPGSDVSWWPVSNNQPPTYMGNVMAEEKATGYGSEWWNAYSQSNARLSDFWMETSRGELHTVGQEVHIVLPNSKSYYDNYTNGIALVFEDIFTALANNSNIDWTKYDKWKKNTSGVFEYGNGDGYVDMMYLVARSNPTGTYAPDGYFRPYGVMSYCTHSEHTVYTSGSQTIKIKPEFDITGAGFQICGSQPLNAEYLVSFAGHEHGHYFMGYGNYFEYHQQYSKINNYHGWEEYLSPYELLRLGYHTPQVADFTDVTMSAGDFSSFTTSSSSEMIKVPIGSSSRNEFFLIANRQHASTYDHLMWGDTARGEPYRTLSTVAQEYGKGIYIYHAYPGQISSSGYPWGIHIDIECADGLWDWDEDGTQHPDWSDEQNVPYYKRTDPVYIYNDNGGEYNSSQSMNNHDGLSLGYEGQGLWFGFGTKHTSLNTDGTDRYWTNRIAGAPYPEQMPYQIWTSREWQGDRWDAWKVGYNEVFSPYSSPSTVDWDDDGTGIFIYLSGQSGTNADLEIYKVGEGGWDLDEILDATPPSRPMNLKSEFCYQSTTFPYYYYNKLTWEHNMEPDMRRARGGVEGYDKRYRIYKVASSNMTLLPDETAYTLLATVDIDENTAPSYIDLSEPSGCTPAPDVGCPPICWTLHAARYRVVAVDEDDNLSVKSDFASSSTYTITNSGGGEEDGDNPLTVPELPKAFTLLQNYPNPFNPSTDIKFELPQNTYVTIKIYNTIGQEVAVLVNNEYKTIGRYSVRFDGSRLASGIYFYSIDAGSFRDTKKMVLIK